MKLCRVCNEWKPLDDFYRMTGMRDGHRNECKSCNLRQKQDRYQQDPQRAIARVKKWQQDNAEQLNAYRRRRREFPEVKQRERNTHLRRKFNLTPEQYGERLTAQDGRCAICWRRPAPGTSLDVHHDQRRGQSEGCCAVSATTGSDCSPRTPCP
jgi:hypothetical protein